MLLERIVSSPANLFVAGTREGAVSAAIQQSGVNAGAVSRTIIWPALQPYINDNAEFPTYNPADMPPGFVWSGTPTNGQTLGFAVSSGVYGFNQYDITLVVFADNAQQIQIDVVDDDTGDIISTPPTGVTLLDGSMDPITGITVEQPFYPYNWQNIRYYSISTGVFPPGNYRLILSFLVVNYDQYAFVPTNPAGLTFVADIFVPLPPNTIFNQNQGTLYTDIDLAVDEANDGDTLLFMPGTYIQDTQLVITKPLTLKGFPLGGTPPQIVFTDTSNDTGLAVQSDDVTVEGLHLVGFVNASALNAVFSVDLRTVAEPYRNFTLRGAIVEGSTRCGYIWSENLTITDTLFLHNAPSQCLRLQILRGATTISNNTFLGAPGSIGAIVIEPNLVSYTTSGDITVSGNTMRRFNQFVNFFAHLGGPTSLVIVNNDVDHETNSGSSVILFSRFNYGLITNLLIQNNRIVNHNPERLAVYYAPSVDGNFIPADGQVKVYNNIFDFYPPPYGRPTDTVFTSPPFPVGFAENSPPGMSLAAFDLQGNTVVS